MGEPAILSHSVLLSGEPAPEAEEPYRERGLEVDPILLGKSVVLPDTPLPCDTRLNIPGIGKGNYLEFVQNKFRKNHHRIRFDLLAKPVVFTRTKSVEWAEFVVCDRSVDISIVTAATSHQIPIFAGMLVGDFLDRVSIASHIPRHLLHLAFVAQPDVLVDTTDLGELLSAVGIHENGSLFGSAIAPNDALVENEDWRHARRRAWLGVPVTSTLEECQIAVGNLKRRPSIARILSSADATEEECVAVRRRMELRLPPDAHDEECEIAEVIAVIASDVHFVPGNKKLRDAARANAVVAQLAAIVRRIAGVKVVIDGHVRSDMPPHLGQWTPITLSLARAEVLKSLLEKALPAALHQNILARGHGLQYPAYEHNHNVHEDRNIRVEVTLILPTGKVCPPRQRYHYTGIDPPPLDILGGQAGGQLAGGGSRQWM